MKLYNIITLGAVVALSFTSCGMEDEKTSSSDMGALEMGVAVKQPVTQVASRTDFDTSNFPVSIVEKESTSTSEINKDYASASVVPSLISLPIGDYTVSSHTPGDIAQKMTAPYYSGSQDFTITKGITTQTTVTCKMQNSRIQLKYSDDFAEKFSTWEITVDEGSTMALSYDQSNLNPDPVYWKFGDNVEYITVNFNGKTVTSSSITDSRIYKKENAAEHYDDDSKYFQGGDALIITMKPAVSATGDVTIDIDVNIVFEDHTDEVDIPVNWEKPIVISEPNNTSYLTNGITFTAGDNYPSNADILFKTTNGINNLSLKVASDNTSFATIAAGLGLVDGDGLDLTSSDAATKLGSYLTLPTKGVKDYTLTLTNILNLLKTYTGQHTFTINVMDTKGITQTVSLVVKVKEGTSDPITITEPNGTNYLVDGVSIKTTDIVFPQDVVLDMDIANGIQSLYVFVTTTSTNFAEAADAMKLTTGDGLDLTSTEAADLSTLFSLPVVGSKIYSFSLNDTLLGLLTNFEGTHNFKLKIVDQNGNTKTAVLTVNVANN